VKSTQPFETIEKLNAILLVVTLFVTRGVMLKISSCPVQALGTNIGLSNKPIHIFISHFLKPSKKYYLNGIPYIYIYLDFGLYLSF
jgi:hypothetical protein